MEKHIDLAATERITVQRSGNETFVLTREQHLEPDNDLNRAIKAEELLIGVEADVRAAFRK